MATQFSFFDNTLYARVQATRRMLGMPDHPERRTVTEHPALGLKLQDLRTGKLWRVAMVRRQWDRGWYSYALVQSGDEYERVIIEAEATCKDPMVMHGLASFQEHFAPVNDHAVH